RPSRQITPQGTKPAKTRVRPKPRPPPGSSRLQAQEADPATSGSSQRKLGFACKSIGSESRAEVAPQVARWSKSGGTDDSRRTVVRDRRSERDLVRLSLEQAGVDGVAADWAAEHVPLGHAAAETAQPLGLCGVLDPFGHAFEVE